MAEFLTLTLSHATYVGASGATAAATYAFFTSGYEPPNQERYQEYDVVKNQNGKFKYLYDNGPGFHLWEPFKVHCEKMFGTPSTLLNNLLEMWNHPGVLGMRAPEGTYTVHWTSNLERSFRIFPKKTADVQEFIVVVQFEEGQ